MKISVFKILVLLLLIGGAPRLANGAEVRILVATNFRDCLQELADVYAQQTGQSFKISSGSSGQLFAQIVAGAPCDLFFAAGTVRPQRLVNEGRAAAKDRLTYAIGQLVLAGRGVDPAAGGSTIAFAIDHVLLQSNTKLAIANPELAPYGRAARQVLKSYDRWEPAQAHLVRGQNVGQTWQFLASGAAQLGFVSLAQVLAAERTGNGFRLGTKILVHRSLHDPIEQQVVVLKAASTEARNFLAYVLGPEGKAIRLEYGYRISPE